MNDDRFTCLLPGQGQGCGCMISLTDNDEMRNTF